MNRLLLVGTMVSLAGGCFVPMSQGLAMQQDLRLLRDRLVAVEDRAEADDAMLREKVAQAQKDADRIAATMSKVDAIARRADANFGEELVSMRQGLGSLQGRLETLEHQGSGVPQASEDIKALRQDIEALQQANKALQEAFEAMKVERKKAASAATPTVVKKSTKAKVDQTKKDAGAATKAKPSDTSSRALFRGGRDALRDRRYAEAHDLMARWVSRYGKEPSKRSAVDDAYVVLGESWQYRKAYKKAIQAYQKVYKMGAKKADMWTKAVFRMGECFTALGDKAGARAFYKMAQSKGRGHFATKSGQRLKRLR